MSNETELLGSAVELALGPQEEDAKSYWRVVTELHQKPSQTVFERCRAWSSSANAHERRLAADVLGQLGYEERPSPFRDETIPILVSLLSDPDATVIASALVAFGHLGAEPSVVEIAALSRHTDSNVRHAVAAALLWIEDPLAIDTLVDLSCDQEACVRDWSTFGLGAQLYVDTPRIREALLARAADPDGDTRAEALDGLVRRGDPRVLPFLLRALQSDQVGSLEVKAAGDLGKAELVTSLEKLKEWWDVDPELLESAIAQCKAGTPRERE
jgi:HEAT repeat protein